MNFPFRSRLLTHAAYLPAAALAAHAGAQEPALLNTESGGSTWSFHHEYVLGTSLDINVKASDFATAQKAEASALNRIAQLDSSLSAWKKESELNRWMQTSFTPVKVSPDLFTILSRFDFWREQTNGALDPSVEAATRLWKQATDAGHLPTDEEIARTREAIQQQHWSLNHETGEATRLTDVPLALASFTKSYIGSKAADAALDSGASGIMINIGGDIVVKGDLWQLVAVADPNNPTENDKPLDYVVVKDRAVATSGSYHRGFELKAEEFAKAKKFSHLFDPRTATPTSHVLSSTVIARDSVTAGALATAFSVLSPEQSQALAAKYPEVQYLIVTDQGEQIRNSGWRGMARLQTTSSPKPIPRPAQAASLLDLTIDLSLPRIEDARYRRPYVAVWVEDQDHFPVRTLALWTQNPRWLPDLKKWYRDDQLRNLAEGVDISGSVSSATRPPGRYTLKWDGKDNTGKPVKPGKYTVYIEASREHGGYEIQHWEYDFRDKAGHFSLPEGKELGAIVFDYRKR